MTTANEARLQQAKQAWEERGMQYKYYKLDRNNEKLFVADFESEIKIDDYINKKGKLPSGIHAAVLEILEEDVAKIDSHGILDLPVEAVVSGRLGDICDKYMQNFPWAYSWPAILGVAGTMVPQAERVEGSVGYQMTTSYCALIGPFGSGKSLAIQHAVGNLGLRAPKYDKTKAGSIEGLLAKLAEETPVSSLTGGVMQRCVDLDEWKHFFQKAGIECASFIPVLNTAWDDPVISLVIAHGKKINLTCALSLIGGIVDTQVSDCFGSESIGGFHDRFLFGICPTENPFEYAPFDPGCSAITDAEFRDITPSVVRVDKSVWGLTNEWNREDPTFGRAIQVTIRCAITAASFDNKAVLTAADLEAWRPFLEYQQACRGQVQPLEGITHDAKMCNTILAWLKKHADDGTWCSMRDLKQGIYRHLTTLGATIFERSLKSLRSAGAIQIKADPVVGKEGRPRSPLIRLVKGM